MRFNRCFISKEAPTFSLIVNFQIFTLKYTTVLQGNEETYSLKFPVLPTFCRCAQMLAFLLSFTLLLVGSTKWMFLRILDEELVLSPCTGRPLRGEKEQSTQRALNYVFVL